MGKANYCIKCTVDKCRYHCNDESYCSLAKIVVGERRQSGNDECCTDCESFCHK
ncbi:MAG: DUF1540 domain-containing protein [Clostridia bacterium]|nr:DUF1540 domain-containing protein [Clostridia bacterium]